MRHSDPSRFLTQAITASGSVTDQDVKGFGRFRLDTAGIGLKVPTPTQDLCRGWEFKVTNATTGLGFALCKGGFVNGRDTVVIPPGCEASFAYYESADGYVLDCDLITGVVAQTHTSDLTWTTADPTMASVALDTNPMYWQLENGICWFEMSISWDDGNAATNLTATIPMEAPCLLSCDIPIMGYLTVDGTETEVFAYIDGSQATAENRIIKMRAAFAATNAKAGSLILRGWYPVYGFTSYYSSATLTWGTENPEAQTGMYLYKILEGIDGSVSVAALFSTLAADGNTSSSLTVTLPIQPTDQNFYVEAVGQQKVNTTWTNPYALVDESTAAGASRLLGFENFQAHTNGNAHAEVVSFFYEVSGWQSMTAVPDWSGGTADPATVPTKKCRYTVIGSQCLGAMYITATDGNGVTNVEIPPPVPPRYSVGLLPIQCMELSDAAMSNPRAYIDTAQTDPFDRLIKMTNFTAIANATNGALTLSWHYRLN